MFQCYTYCLQFKNPFVLATGTRSFTPSVFLKVEQDGCVGWGEATMPPYVAETQESVIRFIHQLNKVRINTSDELNEYFEYLYSFTGNFFAKAAVNNALLNWWAKKQHISLSDFFNLKTKEPAPDCCFTITKGDVPGKISVESKKFSLLKIKAGFDDDTDFIRTVAASGSAKICIDANQGWKNAETALQKIQQLKGLNIVFIEQPLPAAAYDEMKKLKPQSPFTLLADESFQTIDDLPKIENCFHGINIKLMKCGGLTQAYRIALAAQASGLKMLMGCMSESSCGIAAAATLQPLMNWVDLDGPLLISNDPFSGISYENGKVISAKNIQPLEHLLHQHEMMPGRSAC